MRRDILITAGDILGTKRDKRVICKNYRFSWEEEDENNGF